MATPSSSVVRRCSNMNCSSELREVALLLLGAASSGWVREMGAERGVLCVFKVEMMITLDDAMEVLST